VQVHRGPLDPSPYGTRLSPKWAFLLNNVFRIHI
jgi:hypothetical protein